MESHQSVAGLWPAVPNGEITREPGGSRHLCDLEDSSHVGSCDQNMLDQAGKQHMSENDLKRTTQGLGESVPHMGL